MYKNLINNKTQYTFLNPETTVPIPTENEYDNGFMNRYFCQRVNDDNGFIFEINIDIFDELKNNPYWKTSTIRWRLSGPIEPVYNDLGKIIDIGVKQSNKNSISIVSIVLKNIDLYLPNILQFHK